MTESQAEKLAIRISRDIVNENNQEARKSKTFSDLAKKLEERMDK